MLCCVALPCTVFSRHWDNLLFKRGSGGWRRGAGVKSTNRPSRGLMVSSQHPQLLALTASGLWWSVNTAGGKAGETVLMELGGKEKRRKWARAPRSPPRALGRSDFLSLGPICYRSRDLPVMSQAGSQALNTWAFGRMLPIQTPDGGSESIFYWVRNHQTRRMGSQKWLSEGWLFTS